VCRGGGGRSGATGAGLGTTPLCGGPLTTPICLSVSDSPHAAAFQVYVDPTFAVLTILCDFSDIAEKRFRL